MDPLLVKPAMQQTVPLPKVILEEVLRSVGIELALIERG